MACDISKGRLANACKDIVGGLKAVYFINYGDLEGKLTITNGVITAVSGTPSAYKYDLYMGNSLTQNIQASAANGTVFYEQVLALTLRRLSSADNTEVQILAAGRPHILVEDNMGNIMVVGLTRGADLTGGTAVTGDDLADATGYTLTFTGREPKLAAFMTAVLSTSFTIVEGV